MGPYIPAGGIIMGFAGPAVLHLCPCRLGSDGSPRSLGSDTLSHFAVGEAEGLVLGTIRPPAVTRRCDGETTAL